MCACPEGIICTLPRGACSDALTSHVSLIVCSLARRPPGRGCRHVRVVDCMDCFATVGYRGADSVAFSVRPHAVFPAGNYILTTYHTSNTPCFCIIAGGAGRAATGELPVAGGKLCLARLAHPVRLARPGGVSCE